MTASAVFFGNGGRPPFQTRALNLLVRSVTRARSVTDVSVGTLPFQVIGTRAVHRASHAPLQNVRIFGRAVRRGPRVQVYNLLAATMADTQDEEAQSEATPTVSQLYRGVACHSSQRKGKKCS